MNSTGFLSFKTYWGRYLIFSIIVLLIALIAFTSEPIDFPSKQVHFFFLLLIPHWVYWMFHAFFLFDRKFLSTMGLGMRKSSINWWILVALGLLAIVFSLFRIISDSELSALPFFPIGLSILLAAYNIKTGEFTEE